MSITRLLALAPLLALLAACGGGSGKADTAAPVGPACGAGFSQSPSGCVATEVACFLPNGSGTRTWDGAAYGACVLTACEPGYASCDGDGANGCEAVLLTDPLHCGTCPVACPAVANGTAGCAGGVCGVAACDAGFSQTPASCVATQVACAPANGSGLRTWDGAGYGPCAVTGCDPGFADCDGVAATGCEVSTATDAGSCGACGHACPAVANGTAGCAGGVCGVAACDAGFSPADGGCVATVVACAVAHGTGARAWTGAAYGPCAVTACDAGWTDCDADPATGCETSTATDVASCGACGRGCPAVAHGTAGCAGGTCGVASCDMGYVPDLGACAPSPDAHALLFAPPGCWPDGATAFDPGGALSVTIRRGTDGESIQGGTPVACAAGTLRVGDDGLLIESQRTNLVTAPDDPGTETKDHLAQAYLARVEGPGSYELAATGAVASGLPCTVSQGAPCRFEVTAGGSVSRTRSGLLTFAQIEGAGPTGRLATSRFHHGWTRLADAVSIQSPVPPGPLCIALEATPFDAQAWQSTDSRGFFEVGAGVERATAYLASSDSLLKLQVRDASGASTFWSTWVFLGSGPHEFRFGVRNTGATEAGAEIWVDGVPLILGPPSGAGSGLAPALGPIQLGQSAGVSLNGAVRSVRMAPACTDLAAPAFEVTLVPSTLVALGDSISGTVRGGGTPFPNLVNAALGWSGFLNAALSGRRTDQIRAIWGGGVRRQGHATVLLMGGVNDLMFYGRTADEAYANLDFIVRQARGEGRRVVLLNVLPCKAAAAWTPAVEAERLSLNGRLPALCAATGATCVDAAADFDAGDGRMKAAYDGGDGLHPNQAGETRLAELVRAVLP